MSTLHAVLIGINAYSTRPLSGCVNDILAVNQYFKKLCNAQTDGLGMNWNPKFLLAPNETDKVEGIKYTDPTRSNIINAFDHFKDAKEGDFCLLYFSGHGSTVDAPEAFKNIEPAGKLQAIVTMDSREPGKHDLVDKELAYLIAETFSGKIPYRDEDETKKGIHFLVIMDCCHAGSNSRGDEDITARMYGSGSSIAVQDLLGFDPKGNAFYTPFDPSKPLENKHLRHTRYVNMAAARDTELAQEKNMQMGNSGAVRHGVFTYSLISTLEQSGTAISYRELIRRVEMEVRSRVENQIPILEITDIVDNDLLFLKNEFTTPKQEYEITYHERDGIWIMNAGAIQGIVASTSEDKTQMQTADGRIWEVLEVRPSESVIHTDAPIEADKSNRLLRATIKQMAVPKIKVGFAEKLPGQMRESIKNAWNRSQPKNLSLVESSQEQTDYDISPIQNKDKTFSYILTRPKSDIPLFIRHDNATTFLADADKVGKWVLVSKMSNPKTEIPHDAISVEVRVMEGVDYDGNNFEAKFDEYGQLVALANPVEKHPSQITLHYINQHAPALRVKIINNDKFKNYWAGALYLDSRFGINHEFLDIQELSHLDNKPQAELSYKDGGRTYNAIPISLNEKYEALGVTEVTAYFLIFISTKKFDLEKYKQDSLELETTRSTDDAKNGGLRADFGFAKKAPPKDDWFTIKIPVHIHRPQAAQKVVGGSQVQFPGFVANFPAGFSGNVQATNASSAGRSAAGLKQSRTTTDIKALVPPSDLWSGSVSSESVFMNTLANDPGNHISILELNSNTGLPQGQQITIIPNDPLQEDEVIVPFGYDPVTGLYFPLGYTDKDGQVVVDHLPKQTDGIIGSDGMIKEGDDKNLVGSVKLFFHKVVWSKLSGRHDYNKLRLVKPLRSSYEIAAEYDGRNTSIAHHIGDTVQSGKILLLIHGIIGDTEAMLDGVIKNSQLHRQFQHILTFDYENLGTPIEKTAEALQSMLQQCGIPPKSLTIVAHSMGGLVSRYLIEHLGGYQLVNKLIQVGTPNGGSEIGDFRKKLTGWITFALNGVAVFKPYLTVASFVMKGIGNKIFHTLDQMQPGSLFLQTLNNTGKTHPTVPYYLIAGNTTHIEAKYSDDDSAWRKVIACLKDRTHYIAIDYAIFNDSPNDMAVRMDSMKSLPWGTHHAIEECSCDHIHYFSHENSLKKLEEWG